MLNRSIQSKGGKAVISKDVPAACPRCGKPMQGRMYHSYLRHLGLHGLADKYFQGNIDAAQKRLRENGLARQDPFPGNGAWKPYQSVRR
ncbi:MAG: hypothetical protein L0287_07995 [Anaerolineae bacterium]|nr:hypothetical protein [Anaerolineae bacterium]